MIYSQIQISVQFNLATEIYMHLSIFQFLFISEFVQLNEADEAWLFISPLHLKFRWQKHEPSHSSRECSGATVTGTRTEDGRSPRWSLHQSDTILQQPPPIRGLLLSCWRLSLVDSALSSVQGRREQRKWIKEFWIVDSECHVVKHAEDWNFDEATESIGTAPTGIHELFGQEWKQYDR